MCMVGREQRADSFDLIESFCSKTLQARLEMFSLGVDGGWLRVPGQLGFPTDSEWPWKLFSRSANVSRLIG